MPASVRGARREIFFGAFKAKFKETPIDGARSAPRDFGGVPEILESSQKDNRGWNHFEDHPS